MPAPASRFAAAVALECLYLVGRTAWVANIADPVVRELAWTAWRLPFCIAYAWIARDALKLPVRTAHWRPLWLGAAALTGLAGPLSGWNVGGGALNHVVMAATSPIVAFREELFYRAILLRFLERCLGPGWAVLLSSAVFVAFHIGAQTMGFFTIVSIGTAGILFGLIYQRTGNLWLVIAIHAACDVLAACSPGVALVQPGIALYMYVLAIFLILGWHGLTAGGNQQR